MLSLLPPPSSSSSTSSLRRLVSRLPTYASSTLEFGEIKRKCSSVAAETTCTPGRRRRRRDGIVASSVFASDSWCRRVSSSVFRLENKEEEEESETDDGLHGGVSSGRGRRRRKLEEEALLPPGLQRETMPRHVAIIMDGNSRWARVRGLPVAAGHEAGYRALREVVNLSSSWGIQALTVFAFSTENWLRPKAEVDFLMRLFEGLLKDNLQDFIRKGVRICVIGDTSKLPESLQNLSRESEENTKHNTHLELIVALSYSGRSDIVQACQKIAHKVKDGILDPSDVTESVIAEELETNCTGNFPYPDLLIRTSGELRLSNFLLWQSAYTELFFAESLWPDFGEAEYIKALASFQQRQRRYGRRNCRT